MLYPHSASQVSSISVLTGAWSVIQFKKKSVLNFWYVAIHTMLSVTSDCDAGKVEWVSRYDNKAGQWSQIGEYNSVSKYW